ncbi:MAG: hypothetical protein ACJ74Q_15150 [Pyrinomonadaceae bacterium]
MRRADTAPRPTVGRDTYILSERQIPMNDRWPFDESFEEIVNADSWTETTETHAVPPQVAERMRELGVTREPSETGLPLTIGALTALVMSNWPAPPVYAFDRRDDTSVHFKWLGFYFVVSTNLFVEQYQMTPQGEPIDPAKPHGGGVTTDLWPRANAATHTFERLLCHALEGAPAKLTILDEETAVRLVTAEPERPFLFWRGTKIGHGMIGLCSRHVRMWPRDLGRLRLARLSPQLLADLACSSGAAIRSIPRDIYEFYKGGRGCRGCSYEAEHPTIGPFYNLRAVGPDEHGYNFDDGTGPLSDPVYGQPVMRLSEGPRPVELEPFKCERCSAIKPREDGTPCEGCGKGVCLVCLARNTQCPHCLLCALCGADAGESHDETRHAAYLP